jgi:hypothetical protein
LVRHKAPGPGIRPAQAQTSPEPISLSNPAKKVIPLANKQTTPTKKGEKHEDIFIRSIL